MLMARCLMFMVVELSHQPPILEKFKTEYPAPSAPEYHFQNISHFGNRNIPNPSSRAFVGLEHFHDERMPCPKLRANRF